MKVIFECEGVKAGCDADTKSVVSRRTYTLPENEKVLPNIGEIISVNDLQYKIREKKVNYITDDSVDTVLHINTIVFRATREV